MLEIIQQTPLYKFLRFCNEKCSDKVILDCGAGGNQPPLTLFSAYGYKTSGIEIDDIQLQSALIFSRKNSIDLGIIKGDMRTLPYENNQFDCVYSYNSIFHMKKNDIENSILEIKRVLKPSGLLYVNFLSTDDNMCGLGKKVGNNEYEADDSTIHSFHSDIEADTYFSDMRLLIKEKRILQKVHEGKQIKQVFIDYILQNAE